MFTKVVFVALFALVGISFVRAHVVSDTWNKGALKTVEFLNCSDLSGEIITLEFTTYLDVENPCNLNAVRIEIIGSSFLGSQHVFNINGTEVMLAGNKFSGTEREYYIRGSSVFLYKNLYEGQLQAHKVVGIYIHIDDDVYDGDRQIHDIVASQLRLTNNEYRAQNYAFIQAVLPTYTFLSDPRIDDDLKDEVSSLYRQSDLLLLMENKWGLNHTNNLPNGNYERFLRNVMPRLTYDPRPHLN